MKTSELIKQLTTILETHGDIDVISGGNELEAVTVHLAEPGDGLRDVVFLES